MFGSPILDVAIGMVFVYLLLSLICSAANEVIESKLKNRAKSLELGIRNLLGDQGLADKVYAHDLISGLFSDKQGKPSYIPSRTFALALMNTVFPDGATPAGGQAAEPGANPLVSFRATVSALPADAPAAPIKKALLALIDDAQGDVNKLRANIENWYDAAMDRVSGWYKRRVHAIILVLGLVIAVALNADSAYIARHLSTDPALRNSLVSVSQVYAQKENGGEAGKQTPGQPAQPAGESAQTRFDNNLQQLKELGLPMGWTVEGDDPRFKGKVAVDPHLKWPGWHLQNANVRTEWWLQIKFHWLGWLLTALAISLGAPFWFDMLNKLIVVRSTVKPKEKSQDEPSKS
jgi:hypothetical protein